MAETSVRAHHRGGSTGSVALLTSATKSRLVLAGEVDVSANADLSAAVTEAEQIGLPVDVDARNVTFMDSSVIAMLARLAYGLPHRLQVIDPPDVVRFLLDVTGIDELVDIVDEDPGFPSTVAR